MFPTLFLFQKHKLYLKWIVIQITLYHFSEFILEFKLGTVFNKTHFSTKNNLIFLQKINSI